MALKEGDLVVIPRRANVVEGLKLEIGRPNTGKKDKTNGTLIAVTSVIALLSVHKLVKRWRARR